MVYLLNKLRRVQLKYLIPNKRYFFITSNSYFVSPFPNLGILNGEIDIFTGIYQGREDENTWLSFSNVRNLITFKKLTSEWMFMEDDNYIICYEKISEIETQQTIEEKYLKLILRNLLGDTFSHYLFDGVDIDYELLTDNLVSDNTQYEITEVIDNSALTLFRMKKYQIIQIIYRFKQYVNNHYIHLHNFLYNSISHNNLNFVFFLCNILFLIKFNQIK
jgi:hypothetical protein